jgi:subtilisin family serine protease
MVSQSWNLEMVRAGQALEMLRQSSGGGEIDWKEIDVAHIDTGCTRHSAFGPWNGDENDILQVADGVNYKEKTMPPFDPADYNGYPGHGTRTGSVLSSRLPGTFMGVAPGLPTIPYRAVNHPVLASKKSRKRIAAAIRHAVDENCCEIISISLGFPLLNPFGRRFMGKAVDRAYDDGVIVVAAGGQVIDQVTYPGKFSRTIGVGGVREDKTAWFEYDVSSAEHSIDIWAPSDDIPRANSRLQDGSVVEAPYREGDGTSYGTVHVAAAAAIWLAYRHDEIEAGYTEPWQRIEAFRKLLAESSQPMRGDYQPTPGKGILNIEKLLLAGLPAPDDLEEEQRKAAAEIF